MQRYHVVLGTVEEKKAEYKTRKFQAGVQVRRTLLLWGRVVGVG